MLALYIFTENSISQGPCRRQWASHYIIHASRYLCDKEFRYLRTVRFTVAVYWGFHSKLIILLHLTFQHWACVRLYTSCYHLAESWVFNKQLLPLGMCRFPNQKIGEHPFSRGLLGKLIYVTYTCLNIVYVNSNIRNSCRILCEVH